MVLSSSEMRQLEQTAKRFFARGCDHYLSEALQYIAATGDPVEALELLHAMWDSAYAGRREQKEALNAVGQWLEERLHRDPRAASERVALEVGWLRRLTLVEAQQPRHAQNGAHHAPEQTLRFGRKIDDIRRRRLAIPATAPVAPVSPSHQASSRAAPDRLPDIFEAELTQFSEARAARRKARERAQEGKAPKDRLLHLQPVNPDLRPLARTLQCFLLDTPGIDELFAASAAQAGAHCTFYVARKDIEERDGKTLVRRILLTPRDPDGC